MKKASISDMKLKKTVLSGPMRAASNRYVTYCWIMHSSIATAKSTSGCSCIRKTEKCIAVFKIPEIRYLRNLFPNCLNAFIGWTNPVPEAWGATGLAYLLLIPCADRWERIFVCVLLRRRELVLPWYLRSTKIKKYYTFG